LFYFNLKKRRDLSLPDGISIVVLMCNDI